ncbi:MAG: carbohydrate binding domain-containing protein, partial [Candidatus Izemoplasmatales bacterium]|nr:carbohydrate binding domain-containing protein [Candidatus Izemoplasmatales bacterium]
TLRGAGTATASFVDRNDGKAVKIEITNVGTIWHAIQFHQRNIPFVTEVGAMYKMTFWARADVARDIRVNFEETTNNATIDFSIIELTTEWVQYEVIFFNGLRSHPNMKIGFFMGLIDPLQTSRSALTSVYIDDVTFEMVGYKEDIVAPRIEAKDATVVKDAIFDPHAGIKVGDAAKLPQLVISSATEGLVSFNATTKKYEVSTVQAGTFILVYTVTDIHGNSTVHERKLVITDGTEASSLLVPNSNFDIDFPKAAAKQNPPATEWGWHSSTEGQFYTEIKDGQAIIEVGNTGNVAHGVQFYLMSRSLVQGESYQISFRAKASVARPIQLAMESNLMTTVNAYFDLTEEWTTFTFEYTHSSASLTNLKFAFFIGNIFGSSLPGTVWIDSVNVNKIFVRSSDTTKPMLFGVENMILVEGAPFNPLSGVRVYDHYDKSLTINHIVVTLPVGFDTNIPGVYLVTYSITDSSRNTNTYTRKITVVAQEDAVDSRIVFIDPSFDLQTPITNNDNNMGWTLRGAGASTSSFVDHNDGKAVKITITNVGTIWHAIQFHQRNIPFVSEFGSLYKFSFWAKSDTPRDIRINLEETTNNATLDFMIISLTTEWTLYEVYLQNTLRSHSNLKIGFFMGLIDPDQPQRSALTSVYFDDIEFDLVGHVEDKLGPVIYFLQDAAVQANQVFNPLAGLIYSDNSKLPALVISSETEGLVSYNETTKLYTINTATPGVYTLVYTLTDHYGNSTIHNRMLTITALPE